MARIGLKPLTGAGSRRGCAFLALALAAGCAPGRARTPAAAPSGTRAASPDALSNPSDGAYLTLHERAADRVGLPGDVTGSGRDRRFPPLEPAVEPRHDVIPPTNDEEQVQELRFRALRVYGEDDRLDTGPGVAAALALRAPESPHRVGTPDAWAKEVLKASQAVALVVLWSELQQHVDGTFTLSSISHEKRIRDARGIALCPEPDAKYHKQPTAGVCTAWWAAPTLMVTARHCVLGRAADELAFVFRWQERAKGGYPGTPALLEATQVYRGSAFRALGAGDEAGDYAVVELQKAVVAAQDIVSLTMRRSGHPSKGEPLYMLGCPRGLPVKFAGGAQVKLLHDRLPLLRADLDAFHGNSGSPVLSALDHRVVGILVRGKSDFFEVGDPPCLVEARTAISRGGETVLGCPAFQRHIPRREADGR